MLDQPTFVFASSADASQAPFPCPCNPTQKGACQPTFPIIFWEMEFAWSKAHAGSGTDQLWNPETGKVWPQMGMRVHEVPTYIGSVAMPFWDSQTAPNCFSKVRVTWGHVSSCPLQHAVWDYAKEKSGQARRNGGKQIMLDSGKQQGPYSPGSVCTPRLFLFCCLCHSHEVFFDTPDWLLSWCHQQRFCEWSCCEWPWDCYKKAVQKGNANTACEN